MVGADHIKGSGRPLTFFTLLPEALKLKMLCESLNSVEIVATVQLQLQLYGFHNGDYNINCPAMLMLSVHCGYCVLEPHRNNYVYSFRESVFWSLTFFHFLL